jgi:serine/threonine-protein kinase
MERARSWAAAAALAAPIALAVTAAHAQPRTDPVTAQALYDDAKRLVHDGRFAEACPKLEESQKLDPAIGTHYALADCYEKVGRLATAWVAYLDVASEAAAQGRRDRETFAKGRAAALAPRLSRVTVAVPERARAAGLEVRRDGQLLSEAQWGVAVPVDRGTHVVTAVAPGKTPFETSVVSADDGKTIGVEVSPLSDAPVPAAGAPSPAGAAATGATPADAADEHRGLGAQRTIALALGAAGLAGLAVGGVFGGIALSKHSALQQECQGTVCSGAGMQDVDDGRSAGNVSTVAFAAGAVALAGGAVLWLTAPSGRASTGSLRAVPLAGPDGAGVAVRGAW